MSDIIANNPDLDSLEIAEGMAFLVDRELLGLTSEAVDGTRLYGITDEGIQALYMLSMVAASAVTADELHGHEQPVEARQVAQCASALVKAMDEMGA